MPIWPTFDPNMIPMNPALEFLYLFLHSFQLWDWCTIFSLFCFLSVSVLSVCLSHSSRPVTIDWSVCPLGEPRRPIKSFPFIPYIGDWTKSISLIMLTESLYQYFFCTISLLLSPLLFSSPPLFYFHFLPIPSLSTIVHLYSLSDPCSACLFVWSVKYFSHLVS